MEVNLDLRLDTLQKVHEIDVRDQVDPAHLELVIDTLALTPSKTTLPQKKL